MGGREREEQKVYSVNCILSTEATSLHIFHCYVMQFSHAAILIAPFIVRLVKNYAFNHSRAVPMCASSHFSRNQSEIALERLEKRLRRREVLTARWSGENYRQRESQS